MFLFVLFLLTGVWFAFLAACWICRVDRPERPVYPRSHR